MPQAVRELQTIYDALCTDVNKISQFHSSLMNKVWNCLMNLFNDQLTKSSQEIHDLQTHIQRVLKQNEEYNQKTQTMQHSINQFRHTMSEYMKATMQDQTEIQHMYDQFPQFYQTLQQFKNKQILFHERVNVLHATTQKALHAQQEITQHDDMAQQSIKDLVRARLQAENNMLQQV